MEFRQLLYVVELAREKNFSRAAEKLHVAQPSLSQQLSKLERELGVTLFHRSTSSVELTYAGATFVEKAQKVLDLLDQMRQEMDDISQLKKGRLVIGSLPITGSHVLPRVLPEFKKRYPQIEIVLLEETSSNLEMLTAQGQTDITLLTLPLLENSLESVNLIEEEIWLAVPPHHPLAETETAVSLKQLEDESFIFLKKGQGFRKIALELCEKAGFQPHIVFESSNIETVQSLVAAGMGIAFVPQMVTRPEHSPYVPRYVKIEGSPTRTLVIAWRKGRYLSKAAEAFIATMKEMMK